MAEIDPSRDIRFLESVENLKRVVKTATDRALNTTQALQITSCLQQGRLFFEAASAAAGEIRPLLLSYGTIAFAKATILARTFTKLEALPSSHGLSDVSEPNATMKNLRVKIAGDGVFQRAVDVAREVERLSLFDNTTTVWIPTPSCESIALANLVLTLEEILARVGELANLYHSTFSRAARSLSTSMIQTDMEPEIYELQTNIRAAAPTSPTELWLLLEDLRARFPFLSRMSFTGAGFAWDHIGISFDNRRPGGQFPAVEGDIIATNQGASLAPKQRVGASQRGIPLHEILPCSQGGLLQTYPTFSSPVRDGVYLSEIAILYLGTYLLGSLVRYRPQIWIHALYGTEMPDRPRDDATRALIQQFLDVATAKVPQWCVAAIRAEALA